jgi:NAD(P)-dependent dehydrogenase (short-subunit alcohol dehydrogenase family)
MTSGRLAGRTAVVTGAASGIGRAIALRLAVEGAHVVVSDLRRGPRPGPATVPTDEEIVAGGGGAEFVPADVTVTSDLERLIEGAADRHGRLDVLINNAGEFGGSSILETTEADWDRSMALNLRSQFVSCKVAIARMVGQTAVDGVRGRIVNVSSQLGFTAPPGKLAYSVAKAGVAQLTRQLAVDYAGEGLIVNAVAPGRIITGTHPGEPEYLESGKVDAATEYSLSRTPFPRLGRVEDVAGAVLYLVSDECTFVSGHVLMVDGGWLAY